MQNVILEIMDDDFSQKYYVSLKYACMLENITSRSYCNIMV